MSWSLDELAQAAHGAVGTGEDRAGDRLGDRVARAGGGELREDDGVAAVELRRGEGEEAVVLRAVAGLERGHRLGDADRLNADLRVERAQLALERRHRRREGGE